MISSRSWTKTALCNAKIYQNKADSRSLTTSVDNYPCINIAGVYIYFCGDRSQFNRCNGLPLVKTQRICHWSHTSPARYLNKSSTVHQQQQFTSFTAFPASKFTGPAIEVKCLEESRYSNR